MIAYDKLQNAIFEFSYGAALGDAIGQKAFEGNKKPLYRNEEAKAIAKAYIENILSGNVVNFAQTVAELESSFQEYIQEHIDDIQYKKKDGQLSNPKFRFGNAQKLINMLAKNMFLLVYQKEDLRNNFKKCHCPMDNVMIDIVKRELRELGDKPSETLRTEYTRSGKLPWSRLETSAGQYDNFQKCIRYLAEKKGLSPIEYDYWMWKNEDSLQENKIDSLNE